MIYTILCKGTSVVRAAEDVAVVGFDERVGVGIRAHDVRGEGRKGVGVDLVGDAFERRHLRYAAQARSVFIHIDAPLQTGRRQLVVDRRATGVGEAESGSLPFHDLGRPR